MKNLTTHNIILNITDNSTVIITSTFKNGKNIKKTAIDYMYSINKGGSASRLKVRKQGNNLLLKGENGQKTVTISQLYNFSIK